MLLYFLSAPGSQARCIMSNVVPEHQDSRFSDYEDVEDSCDNDDDNEAYDLTALVTMVCLCFMPPNVH